MVERVFIFIGVVLCGVAALVYTKAPQSNDPFAGFVTCAIVGGLGLLFLLLGIVFLAKSKQNAARLAEILSSGTPAEATVTYVDRNFRIRVNGQPVYSIVEYRYQDGAGMSHVRRITDASTDVVVRSGIAVGSKVEIRISRTDPSKSALILTPAS